VRFFVTILKNSVPEKLPNNNCLFEKLGKAKISGAKQKNNVSKNLKIAWLKWQKKFLLALV